MPHFSARISFNVTYHGDTDEAITRQRAQMLADTMLAVLRTSTKIKLVAIEAAEVEYVDEEGS